MTIKELSLKNTSIANNILNTYPYIIYMSLHNIYILILYGVPDYRMFKGGKIQTWL